LWTLGAVAGAILIAAVLAIVLTQPHLPGTRYSLIGTVFLMAVFELFIVLKAAQAFLNWKDPDAD